jgi:hypothetical protein
MVQAGKFCFSFDPNVITCSPGKSKDSMCYILICLQHKRACPHRTNSYNHAPG